MMNFEFKCPQCGQMVELDETCRGQVTECPFCGKEIVVPHSNIQVGVQRKDSETTQLPAMVKTVTRTAMDKIVTLWKNDKRWGVLFAAISAMMVIQLIMLYVLIFHRGTGGLRETNSSASGISQAVISLPPGTPSELLLKYTEQGEISYVAAVLKQNPSLDVNRPRAAGNKTALYLACEKGYVDIVQLLLKQKADVTTCCDVDPNPLNGRKGYSPFTIAASNGHLDVVKFLLSSGVDIESRDASNRTALYAAALKNKQQVVQFLCESKAKVNIYGIDKFTPLTVAAHRGNVEVVKVLLKYGSEVEMRDGSNKYTPLYYAAKENHPEVVEILCQAGANVNADNGDYKIDKTPLDVAKFKKYTEVIKILEKYSSMGKPTQADSREAISKPGRDGVPSPSATGGGTPALPEWRGFASKRKNKVTVKSKADSAIGTSKECKKQREIDNTTKEFSGSVCQINDDCTIVIRDFTKGGIYFGVKRKVRLDGIKVNDRAKEFLRNRLVMFQAKVRVTYKELDWGGTVKGTIWDGATNGKSLNDILVEDGYAEYDN